MPVMGQAIDETAQVNSLTGVSPADRLRCRRREDSSRKNLAVSRYCCGCPIPFIISCMLTGVPLMWLFALVISRTSTRFWSLPLIFTSCHGVTLSLIQYSVPSFLLRQCWHENVPAGVVTDSLPRFSALARKSAFSFSFCMLLVIMDASTGGRPGIWKMVRWTMMSSAWRTKSVFEYIVPCDWGKSMAYSIQYPPASLSTTYMSKVDFSPFFLVIS